MTAKDLIIAILVVAVFTLGAYIYLEKNSQKATLKNQGGDIQQQVSSIPTAPTSTPIAPTKEPEVIGEDKDEYGCIPSAGYSWCAEKNKCLRSWEEKCEDTKEAEIISVLAKKHGYKDSETTIEISKESGDYVKGMVRFPSVPGGVPNAGMFLATKINGNWTIVYDGHGVADCDELINKYKFPKSVLIGMCE